MSMGRYVHFNVELHAHAAQGLAQQANGPLWPTKRPDVHISLIFLLVLHIVSINM